MSNSDFDRSVNLLQGILNNAVFEAEKAKQTERVYRAPATVPEATASTSEPEPQTDKTPDFAPLPEPEELMPPPAEEPAACTCARKTDTVSRKAAALTAAASLGLGVILALLLTPAPAPASHDACLPADLVLSAEDLPAWQTAATMHGTLDGNDLRFSAGKAEANGTAYTVALDFCVNGDTTYVKVNGNGAWIACVNKTGEITKSYPAPKNGKPLKDIFGPRPKK